MPKNKFINPPNRVNSSDICELAHILTQKECHQKKLKTIITNKEGDTSYPAKAQKIFDRYYDLITNTLNV